MLAVGLLLTIVYIFGAATLYESIYYEREFSNEMYNEALYLPLALMTAAAAWCGAAVYYYAIDSVRFSRWYHWLMVLILTSAAGGAAGYLYPDSVFGSLGYDFGMQLSVFSIVATIVEAALFVTASFSLRWWSTNCRHTPFPE